MRNIIKKKIIEFPTFLTKDLELDKDAIEKSIERLLVKGVERILIMGAAGEYGSVCVKQQNEFIQIFKEHTNKAEIIIGILETAAPKIVERVQSLHSHEGFAFAFPVHYHFGISNFDEVIRQYKVIKAEIKNEIYAYDFPDMTKYKILSEDVSKIVRITEIKDVIFSDTGLKCGVYNLNNKAINPEHISSRAAFLFPDAQHELTKEINSMLDLVNHPAAALKYSCVQLGYCESYELFSPYRPPTYEQQSRINIFLEEIKLKRKHDKQ